jgi:hypothetical protein
MEMKKTFAIIAAALISTAAFAQAEIGIGYVNSTYKDVYDHDLSGSGLYVGASYNFNLVNLGEGTLGVAPGVYYQYNSCDKKFSYNGIAEATYKIKEHFINIPVEFSYTYPVARDLSLAGYAGPIFSIGVSGEMDGNASVLGYTGSGDADLYSDAKFDQFDIQLGIGFGIIYDNTYKFMVGYDWGLRDRVEDVRHDQVRLGIAYLF